MGPVVLSSTPRRRAGALVLAAALLAGCASGDARRLRTVPRGYTGELTTWWSDAQKKEEGRYRDGLPDGELRGFHPDGSLAFEGAFAAGVPVGEHRTYHTGGAGLRRRETWVDGVLDGVVSELHPGGAPALELHVVAGRRHGAETRWSAAGQVVLEGRWEDDLPAGCWRFLGDDGHLLREEFYWNEDGVQVGRLATELREDGSAKVQELLDLRDGVWAGWRSYWHANGRQSGLEEWVGGRRQGRDLAWNAHGVLVSEGRREADARAGVWTSRDEHGQVTRRVRYEAGEEVEELPLAPEGGG